jgi:predicted transcriptional regulator
MKIDTSKEGLHALFKPYQVILMEFIWGQNNPKRTGITSGQAHKFLQSQPDKKSRASVINFLNDMVDEGVLDYEEESGKGGYHRVYYPNMDKARFSKYVTKTITDKLHEVFQN